MSIEQLDFIVNDQQLTQHNLVVAGVGHSDTELNLLFTLNLSTFSDDGQQDYAAPRAMTPSITHLGAIRKFNNAEKIIGIPTMAYCVIICKHEFYVFKY